MCLLLMNEFYNYKRFYMTTLMYVDKNRGSDNLQVNMDIDFYNMPCELLSIEIRNDLGLRVQNIEGNLTKHNLDEKHQIIGEKPYILESLGRFGHDHDHIAQPDYEVVKKQINNKEGCKLKGSFFLDAVPGVVIISSNAFAPTIDRLRRDKLDNTNVAHIINRLSFGDNQYRHRFYKFGHEAFLLMNTLRHKKRIDDKLPMTYQYYLKIVPTKFRYLIGKSYDKYQYTANSFSDTSLDRLPLLFFNFYLFLSNFIHFSFS